MQSSTAFKAACLSIGLATAWSPVGTPVAKGDTVQVSLSFNGSPADPIYLGFKTTGSTQLAGPFSFSGDGDYTVETGLNSADLLQYVAVGWRDAATVIVSFASPADPDPYAQTFNQEFPGFDENQVAADLYSQTTSSLTTFIDSILQLSNVPQNLGTPATLVSFSTGSDYGSVTVSLGTTAVPLPPGVLMGGALLALVVSGKRGASWVRARRASNLPCV
jgi:hypothetical protein